jgi:hypothetical protein
MCSAGADGFGRHRSREIEPLKLVEVQLLQRLTRAAGAIKAFSIISNSSKFCGSPDGMIVPNPEAVRWQAKAGVD